MSEFTIPGKPVAKGRPRFSNGRAYTPATTKAFEKRVRIAALQAGIEKIDGPVWLQVSFGFQTPKSKHRKRNPVQTSLRVEKPDIDNLLKAIMDGLNGIAYDDDAQVCAVSVKKYTLGQTEDARTEVAVGGCG